MKTIGLIGGMSWESSLEYYRILNERVKQKVSPSHSCKCILYSVDFAEVEELQHQGKWEELTHSMREAAVKLEQAGADLLVICSNTMHLVVPDIEKHISIPLLHIVDATGEQIKAKQMQKVGLLGTKFTMEQDFYRKRLREKFEIKVLIPDAEERETIHHVIYQELISGVMRKTSRNAFKKIIKNLQKKGAEGIILGCTEIPLLIKPADSEIPIFDTTRLHAQKAVAVALGN